MQYTLLSSSSSEPFCDAAAGLEAGAGEVPAGVAEMDDLRLPLPAAFVV